MTNILSIDTDLNEIIDNFSFLDDWEDRYGYLIELGKALRPLAETDLNEDNKVQGCVSQVWLKSSFDGHLVHFEGASDAHIVRGLVAIALNIFSGKSPDEILATDEGETFRAIGLKEHLTPQRSNGLKSMVLKIKTEAEHFAKN